MTVYLQQFTVKGCSSGSFPIDMLRYDVCWPYMEQDAAAIENTGGPNAGRSKEVVLQRHVFRKTQKPTIDRWESFGWRVIDGTIETRKIAYI